MTCHDVARVMRGVVWCGVMVLGIMSQAWAAVEMVDDASQRVHFAMPPQRIISLAPHLTEFLFALGAEEQLVAVDRFSDAPLAAQALPRVGDALGVNFERALALKPDVVLLWGEHAETRVAKRFRSLGVPVVMSAPQSFEAVATTFERLGVLTGRAERGAQLAAMFRRRIAALKATYAAQKPLTVFIQIAAEPLMTVGRRQFISEMVRLCGGRPVFDEVAQVTATVTVEAVLARRPDVILALPSPHAQRMWQRWPQWAQRVKVLPPDIASRPGPRLVEGTQAVCQILADTRKLITVR